MNLAETIARYRLEHGDAQAAEMLARAYPPADQLRRRATTQLEGGKP